MIIDRKTAAARYGGTFVETIMEGQDLVRVSPEQDRVLTLYKRVKEDYVIPFKFQTVYIVEADNGAVKVGYTTNIKRRFRGLCGMYPGKLRLHDVALFWFGGAWEAEAKAHKALADDRINGEWFRASPEDISATVDRLISDMPDRRVTMSEAWEDSATLEPFYRVAWKGDPIRLRAMTDAKASFMWLVDALSGNG